MQPCRGFHHLVPPVLSAAWRGRLATGRWAGTERTVGRWRERRAGPRPNAGSRRRGTRGCAAQTPAGIETQLLLEVLAAHCNIVHPAASPWGFSLWLGTQLEKMSNVNWKPFVFGGLASVTAECGEWCGERRGGPAAWRTVHYLILRGDFFFLFQSYTVVIALICVAGTFPIDLAKTRLQVQGQVGDIKYREIRYRGMLHAIVRIVREEGLRALYSGSVCVQHLYACLC